MPNLNPPNDGLAACVVFVVVADAASPPLEPNLNGSGDDDAVTKKPCDVVGFATCVLEPNWKGAGVGEVALATVVFVLLALNMGIDGSTAVVPTAVPKHGCAGAIEGVLEIGLLPPSDGPEKTKPPAAGFTASGAGTVTAADAVGIGRDSADVCGDGRDAAEMVGVGKDWDTAGEAAVVASVAFGDVNFAKAANNGFAAAEAAVAGSDAGATCVTASEAVVLAVVVELELKKPAPN